MNIFKQSKRAVLFMAGCLAGSLANAIDSGGLDRPDFFYFDYTKRDYDVVDYQTYTLPGVDIWKFRGPKPDLKSGNYFTAIGASQTFGPLVDKPYPTLLSEELGMEALNLGLGGATPSAYADEEAIIQYINKGKFLILQIMGGRIEANSKFSPTKHHWLVRERDSGQVIGIDKAWSDILKGDPGKVPFYVEQSRNAWVKGYLDLLEKVEVPVILFWFSPRDEEAQPNYGEQSWYKFLGKFPPLIDQKTLSTVRSLCDYPDICADYVEVKSNRQRQFDLKSRFTGEPTEIDHGNWGFGLNKIKQGRNTTYPSPEMHQDAVAPLIKAIKKLDI